MQALEATSEQASGVFALDALLGLLRALSVSRRKTIKPQHEALLGWYFTEGQSVFERSTFGALLERQAHFAFRTRACPRCGGQTFTNADCEASRSALAQAIERRKSRLDTEQDPERKRDIWAEWHADQERHSPRCRECAGEGWVPDGRVPAPRPMRVHCKMCRGTGADRHGDACELCFGQGMRGGYDANGLGESGGEPGYEPDHEALRRYAIVSRWLSWMPPRHATVVEAYYGLVGCRWGATKLGRIFSVYGLTHAGKRLLARIDTPRLNPNRLPRHELLGTLALNQLQAPVEGRGEQLEACRVQSWALYRDASQAWLRTVS